MAASAPLPIYRCACGHQQGSIPSQGDDACQRCGTALFAQHVGSAVSAQPSPQAVLALKSSQTVQAAPAVPTGNPNAVRVTKSIGGKTVVVDARTGLIVVDGR